MNEKKIEAYKREFAGLSRKELQDKLWAAFIEVPDAETDIEFITALSDLLEAFDPTPGDAPTSLDNFREKHTELFGVKPEGHPKVQRRPHRPISRILMIAAILSGLLLLSANARIMLNWHGLSAEQYTQIQTDSLQEIIDSWHEVFVPTAVPDGFTLIDANKLVDFWYTQYSNSDGSFLAYYQNGPESTLRLDTQDVIKTEVRIGAYTAQMYEKRGTTTITWDSMDRFCSVEFDQATISLTEIERFVASLEWQA